MDKSLINVWLKTTDLESFSFARELIRTEGLLIGGSSGSAIAGAMRWLKGEGWAEYGSRQDRNVVVMLPDSLRNYVTKDWLLEGSASEV